MPAVIAICPLLPKSGADREVMLLSNGQMSDYKGAALMLDAMRAAPVLIVDDGYEDDWLRQTLRHYGDRPCIRSLRPLKADPPRRQL